MFSANVASKVGQSIRGKAGLAIAPSTTILAKTVYYLFSLATP
jgi:hypothetical protein